MRTTLSCFSLVGMALLGAGCASRNQMIIDRVCVLRIGCTGSIAGALTKDEANEAMHAAAGALALLMADDTFSSSLDNLTEKSGQPLAIRLPALRDATREGFSVVIMSQEDSEGFREHEITMIVDNTVGPVLVDRVGIEKKGLGCHVVQRITHELAHRAGIKEDRDAYEISNLATKLYENKRKRACK